MKKILMLLLLGGLFSTASMAQEQKDMKRDKAEWEKKMKEELKLSDEQVAKYDALNKEFKDKMELVNKDANLTKEAQKEKKTSLKKEKETRLNEILTPDQQAKYKELKDKMKKEKPGT